ncbi:MAG: carbohydrate ABC transporter permease [Eubacteriales bacterium]|nr:carbohydrate ABC transporter permease [Eubacteriales bacterium]
MPIKEGGLSRKVFVVCNSIFLFLMMIITLYPLWLQFITSISHGLEVMKGGVTLLPRSPTLETYKTIVRGELFMYMKNTIVYTVVGTVINLAMSCLCAYPLARKTFSGRKFFTMLVTFTMFFSGGMIPLYLTVKQFGMMDTIWALVLPGAISTYNMIVIRTAFQSIPDSLIESAQLDGANDLIILWKIVVPLSKATLATMLLFYSVTHWNSYFDAMLYINKKEMYPLQIMLRNMLIGGLFNEETAIAGANADSFAVTDATLRSAAIIVTTLPILVVYPFVQRYFVKGVMIGGVKG